jgi:hypothetical protein
MHQELHRALDRAGARRAAILAALAALPDTITMARPSPDLWSLAEIVEHLAVAERTVYRGLPDFDRLAPRSRSVPDAIRATLVRAVLASGLRVRVPSDAMRPTGQRSLAAAGALWEENARWLRSYIDWCTPSQLALRVFHHPIAGPLSPAEAIALGATHLASHVRQIARVRAQLGG